MNTPESRLLFSKLEAIESKIEELSYPSGWLDLKGAQDYCGLSISTLKRAVYGGKLKVAKGTGKWLFRRSWLDQFLLVGHCKRLNSTERAKVQGSY